MRRVALVLLVLSLVLHSAPSWAGKQGPDDGAARQKVIERLIQSLFAGGGPGIEDVATLVEGGSMTPAAQRLKEQNARGPGAGAPTIQAVEYTDKPLADGTYAATFSLSIDGTKEPRPVNLLLKNIGGAWKIVLPKYGTAGRSTSARIPALLTMFIRPSINFASPESVIAGFIGSINAMDFARAKSCLFAVEDSSVTDYAPVKSQLFTYLLLSAPTVVEKTPDRITYKVPLAIIGRPTTNELAVVKSGTKWLIMPGSRASHHQYSPETFVSDICIDLADLNAWKFGSASKATVSNVRQVATGVMMYLADQDDTFSLTDKTLVSKLQPYLKNRAIFTSAAHGGTAVAIHFNDRLNGRVRKTLAHPERLIMLYDGANGQPLFRYGGRASIATADGAARLVTREEYVQYRWTP